MPSQESSHFDEYTAQNRAKHSILAGYLFQYLVALKNSVRWFHYIDGFAGRGSYAGNPGSPIVAIEALKKSQLLSRATLSLVEERSTFAEDLTKEVGGHNGVSELRWAPIIKCGTFSEHFEEITQRDIYRAGGKVATFAFIDPCGVEGVRLEDIGEILDHDYGEVLLFFNFDGMNRVLGAMASGALDSAVPRLLLGNKDRADQMLLEWSRCEKPESREILIRDSLISAIRTDTKARFFVPFRFESADKSRTSHYLVHCSSHPLAFKFMKGVMSSVGREDTDAFGKLEFLNDFERGKQFALFRQDVELRKEKIISRVQQGPCRVSLFTNDWVSEPEDPFSERGYKQMLIRLEEEGKLIVFEKANSQPAPAPRRPKRRGLPTLADDYWIRAPQGLF